MVGGGGAVGAEERPPVAMGVEVAGPGGRIASCQLAEPHEVLTKSLKLRIDHRIRPIGRDDAAAPTRLPDRLVMSEPVEGALGGGDGLDAEALEQGPRAKVRRPQSGVDPIVIRVRVDGREALLEPEQGREGVIEPGAGRGPAEQMIMGREEAPDPPGIALDPRCRPGPGSRDPPAGRPGCRACGRRSDRGSRTGWRDPGTARSRHTSGDPYGRGERRSAGRARIHKDAVPPRAPSGRRGRAGPRGSASWRNLQRCDMAHRALGYRNRPREA